MIALFPGTFDPPHRGHLDLIRRAAGFSQRLIVAVAANPDKRPLLAAERRVALLTEACRAWPSVTVATYAGGTAAFARAQGATALVRGVRGAADLEFERGMAAVHRDAAGLETILLLGDGATGHLSSSLVRDAARAGLPLASLVTPPVADALRDALGG
jgi:pantetheine-phosphate adenylyltransferase